MSHRTGVYVGEVPIYTIEARRAQAGSYHLLTTTYSISGKSTVNCDLLQDDTQTLHAQYVFGTNFPPAAVQFAPRTVSADASLVMTAGEAIGVWDQGRLSGFCVPEALKSVGLPLAGRESSQQPVWGVTAAKWTDKRPATIVAAHRSGSLGVYHVDRLPGARRSLPAMEVKPRGIFDRFAKLFTTPTNTPARTVATPESSSGNGCHIFAHLPATPSRRLSPGPSAKPSNSFFCTDLATLDANVVAAAHNADSALALFDTREKPQQWTPQSVSGGHPKFVSGLGDYSMMTLDKTRGELHIFDTRTASDNSVGAHQSFQISDVFGYPVVVNDALVSRSTEVVLAIQRDHSIGRANALNATDGILSKLDFGSLREGICGSRSSMGSVLNDDNCAMALAADDSMMFWVEVGIYMPGSGEDDWWRVSDTPYSGEALKSSKWVEPSGSWIHMLPLR